MKKKVAEKPNPASEAFTVLLGEWKVHGTHPYVPNELLHGTAVFEWVEGGAFLTMRAHIEDKRFPDGVAIFGSDDATGEFFQLYFDERGVSRKYDVAIQGNTLKWWRNSEEFSQRMTLTIDAGSQKITGKGEMNRDGKGWEPDIQLTYTRV